VRSAGCGALDTKINPNQRAEYHAIRAWARAAAGDRPGAVEDEEQAMGLCVSRIPYAAGEVGWLLGQARREMGDAEGARHHFARARAADPRGLSGRLCAEALAGA